MPLFDFRCLDCGSPNELLLTGTGEKPQCTSCGSANLEKLLSAHSSLSGHKQNRMPGPSDTGCCGSSIEQASCAGPGSCCGKNL